MKQIIKKFNNLIKKTIFKVENKTNNIFQISSFNKCLITFIVILFSYIFYLLIPILYDKNWLQNSLEKKILNEFKINVSSSADISYRILPAPHFLIKNSKILLDDNKSQKITADVKSLKVFLSQKNFFNKEKINLKKLVIDSANFYFLRNELKILSKFNNNQFSSKKIKIHNSNIFLKSNLNEIITIIQVKKAILFFNDEKQLNLFNLKGSIFGVPFFFELDSKNDSINKRKINLEVKSLKLNILNEIIEKDDGFKYGKIFISFLKSIVRTKYSSKEQIVTFESDNSKLSGSLIDYNGSLSINPFDLNLNINLGNYKISQLFNLNSILEELIISELLFNDNLSLDILVFAKTDVIDELFQNIEINFTIVNGKINFDNTKLVNDKIGALELNNSNLFLKNNELILNTDIQVSIQDYKSLFSFLNTNKKLRKKIQSILINLDYNFLSNQIKFNNIIIDNNNVSDQFLNVIDNFNNNNNNNLIKSRRLINELLNIYDG